MTRVTDPQASEGISNEHPQNGKTILIAEDDPFISRMYETKLTGAGYQVVMANNGRDAYEQIKAVAPDLVMLDINMPELSGFEVIHALQGDGSTLSNDRIIVLTNSANPVDRQAAAKLGIDYLIKADLTPHEVLDRINKKLGHS